jgi:2,3-bisphosphoglycerate-independent phosphoglycerate mutase
MIETAGKECKKLAYDLLVNGIGTHSTNAVASIEESYEVNVNWMNLFHPTVVVDEYDQPVATIEEDDVVIFFNFRTDRGKRINRSIDANRLSAAKHAQPLILRHVDQL